MDNAKVSEFRNSFLYTFTMYFRLMKISVITTHYESTVIAKKSPKCGGLKLLTPKKSSSKLGLDH